MKYETVFFFDLNETRDNIPQKAHVDMAPEVIDFEERFWCQVLHWVHTY